MTADTDLLIAFLETRYPTDLVSTDLLTGPERARDWLVSSRLLEARESVSAEEARRLVHLRAAITALLRERMGAAADDRTRPTIEAASAGAPLRVVLTSDGESRLVPVGSGVNRAMAEIVAALHRAELAGDLVRVKACKACGRAFEDLSKNRSRIWCDMSICGSQEKARAYRRRHAEAAREARAG
ncbi:MAG: CGNR zinc finger domain-containing protein [Tepidiformaceae bacterium]